MFKRLFRKLYKQDLNKSLVKDPNMCYNIYINKNKEKDVLNLKNFQKVLADYKGKNFKVSATNKLNQLERNEFKASVIGAIASDLADAGVEIAKVDKGYAILIPNEQLGAIVVSVDAVVKGLDYDYDFEVAEQIRKDVEKAEKAKAKAQG